MNDGLTEEEARLKPNRKLNGVDLDQFMDYKKAVKVAIPEYKHVLESYLDEVIDNENSDEDAASDDDEEEED